MKKLFTVALLLVMVHLNDAGRQQECDTHKLGCPPNSVCTPSISDDKGLCKCFERMEVNEHSTGPSDYCIPTQSNSLADIAAMKSNAEKEKEAKEVKTVVHIQPPPESHHVIVGILVPMALVLVIIGAAYGIKKFHPVRRLREYVISRRRNRPLYEDVMMTQELDDPPLM